MTAGDISLQRITGQANIFPGEKFHFSLPTVTLFCSLDKARLFLVVSEYIES